MPHLLVLAGPNGAGKTTLFDAWSSSGELDRGVEYLNPDRIASTLGLGPIDAGKESIRRLRHGLETGADLVVETTLAWYGLAAWIDRANDRGYLTSVIFLSLATPELAVERVATRVALGEHDVPEDTIRRRWRTGKENFLTHFWHRVDEWYVYDNTNAIDADDRLSLLAAELAGSLVVHDPAGWNRFVNA